MRYPIIAFDKKLYHKSFFWDTECPPVKICGINYQLCEIFSKLSLSFQNRRPNTFLTPYVFYVTFVINKFLKTNRPIHLIVFSPQLPVDYKAHVNY